ncbi:MAG: lysyl oxidase family protein, partial [Anaerolineales bacterium]
QVLTGDGCTSYETGLLAFGRAKSWADLNGLTITLRGERISLLRRLLSSPPPAGTNNVMVGNELDIMDVAGIALAQGEVAIYQPLGKTGYAFVARLLPDEWGELGSDLPDLVQVEPCDSDDIQLELLAPIDGAQAHPKPKPEKGDGNGEICLPEQQLGFSEDLPLPDLTTLPPFDLRIRVNPSNGQKLLRFSNSIMNMGLGAMELSGKSNPDTGKVTVDQHIFTVTGTEQKVTVGEFFFHAEHNHWHFGRFSRYEIWSLGSDGELESIVAFSDKISYCLRDDSRADIPNAAARQTYSACDQNIQGISIGWIDTYRHHLEGQSIDITALPDGAYALRSVVDPDKKLWDRNYENNAAILYIQLEGNSVTVIESEAG